MIWRTLKLSPAVALLVCATYLAGSAQAATVNSNTSVGGTFNSTLSGSGSAQLTSASGTFRQWLGFFHTNISVSAPQQTVGLNIPQVNPGPMNASGDLDFDFDNFTPGTPQAVNALDLDLNGNTTVPFTINVNPMQINTSLGNFQLQLTVNGTITDIFFNSTGGEPTVGNEFSVPGDYGVSLFGNVTGQLVNVPLIGNINLGNLFTIDPTTLPFSADFGGDMLLSDLDGGLPPFPNDMQVILQNLAGTSIPVPLSLPIAVAINQTVPNGQSGFSVLNITGNIDATLELGNVSYDLAGVVNQVLVPEPGSIALGVFGLLGLIAVGIRRRRAA